MRNTLKDTCRDEIKARDTWAKDTQQLNVAEERKSGHEYT